MKGIGKRLICIAVMIALFGMLACVDSGAQPRVEATAVPTAEIAEVPQEDEISIETKTEDPIVNTPVPTAVPTPEETPTLSPTDTPVPSPVTVTIGAVGDIMIPSGILSDAKTGNGEYDFSNLFAPFSELFQSVDLMCGNFETPLAGKEAGFSQRKDKTGALVFNAPDSVLDALKESGVDMLTTANNHCLDMGADALYRTIETIRAAGFIQTGTFLNAQDRETPCIVELNGIRIGFVASTRNVNSGSAGRMRDEEKQTAIAYLLDGSKLHEAVVEDIRRVREAGAEFVILFAHWDYENDNPTSDTTRQFAKQLLEAGADCIIGSHPHRVKEAEFVTVQRSDGPYTGLVLYSLGNFTANNTFEKMVGLFAKITLEKDFVTGKVTLCDAAVLPTFSIRRGGDAPRFTVLPVYADTSMINGLRSPLSDSEIRSIAKAREHALKRLGNREGIRILDEPPD